MARQKERGRIEVGDDEVPESRPYRMTPGQIRQVYDTLDTPRDRTLFLLYIASGCAPRLLAPLTCADGRQLLQSKKFPIPLGGRKKRVYENPLAVETLRNLRALLKELDDADLCGDDDPLFRTRSSVPSASQAMRRTGIVSFINGAIKNAGVERRPMTVAQYKRALKLWKKLRDE